MYKTCTRSCNIYPRGYHCHVDYDELESLLAIFSIVAVALQGLADVEVDKVKSVHSRRN